MGMTSEEAARVLNVTKGFISRLCKKGILNAKKHGRDWDIDPESVEKYRITPKDKGGRPRINTTSNI
jgi:excisionase family DNA binding protein